MTARYPGDAFRSRFGPWAVVAGGSDGIGLEICIKMAVLGFNICMIGRNPSKHQKAIAKIQDANPKIKTMYVDFDFGKYVTIKDYQDKIGP